MHIGIDGLPLTEPLAGIGHYTLELARHLADVATDDQIDVLSPRSFLPTIDSRQGPNLRFIKVGVNALTGRWWSIGLPLYVRQKKLDLFHGTNFDVPLRRICPTVVTIHDLSQLLLPHTHEQRSVWRARRRLPLMVRRATMVLTVSDAIRKEIHEHLKVPLDRIVTVHLAARQSFKPTEKSVAEEICQSLGITSDFVLYSGTLEPRKNLRVLFEAFAKVRQESKAPVQLVLAGKKGWLVDDWLEGIKGSDLEKGVIFAGYLHDEQLCALYSTCRVLVYPSLYEGFGLPPLEGMVCGAPVIASTIPAIKEVTAGAALLVNPDSVDELAKAISSVVRDEALRSNLVIAGK